LSDAATQWPLDTLEDLLQRALEVWHASRRAVEPSSRQ
jgi:hypothetical protein